MPVVPLVPLVPLPSSNQDLYGSVSYSTFLNLKNIYELKIYEYYYFNYTACCGKCKGLGATTSLEDPELTLEIKE